MDSDAPATPAQKAVLGKLTPDQVTATELAGERIRERLTAAPGNGAAIGGLKVTTASAGASRPPRWPRQGPDLPRPKSAGAAGAGARR